MFCDAGQESRRVGLIILRFPHLLPCAGRGPSLACTHATLTQALCPQTISGKYTGDFPDSVTLHGNQADGTETSYVSNSASDVTKW
jgi:hypothetical protein